MTANRDVGSAATAAIEPAFKTAFGVSIIAHSLVRSGAPEFAERPGGGHDRARPVDLGQENGVRAGGGGGDEIGFSPRRVRPIDTDDDLAPAERADAHGLGDLFARDDFLVRGDRILEIKDQRVGDSVSPSPTPWRWSRAYRGRFDAGEQA